MRIGICLSGGGARGIAHLGVLKALQEKGIPIHAISGVSSGAIAGTFVAAGFAPDKVLELVCALSPTRFLRPALNKGILSPSALHKIFEEHLSGVTFEDLSCKVIISALDLVEGSVHYFSSGLVTEPLVASATIPVLFKPTIYKNKLYVDGGLVNNLPVECLQGECDFVIGVHTNPTHHSPSISGIRQVTERIFHLALHENVRHRIPLCDFFIEPSQLKDYHIYALDKAEEIFSVGYRYALDLADELKNRLVI